MIFRKRGAVTTSFVGKQEFIAKVRACQMLAREQFNMFTLMDAELPIVFFAKGTTAGLVKFKRVNGDLEFNIEFNIDAIDKNWDDMVNDTIPHEMAHIVDVVIHGRSNGHNHVWSGIAHRLGCSGTRTHNYDVQNARKTKKFMYVSSCGRSYEASTILHKKIQHGNVYTFKDSGGRITREGFTGEYKVS